MKGISLTESVFLSVSGLQCVPIFLAKNVV